MSPPRVETTITLGNIITLAVMIFGGGVAWSTLQAETRATRDLIAIQTARMDALERADAEIEVRTRALELGAGRTDEKLINILAVLDRIEDRLGAAP